MRKIYWPIASAILLMGCVTDNTPTPNTSTPGQAITVVAEPLSSPRSPFGIDTATGDINLEGPRNYMRGVLRQLAQTLPANAPHAYTVDVFTTAEGYGGKATIAGDILIGLGAVIGFANEDGLAFLLAHELAHLHQDHLSEEREASTLDTVTRRIVAATLAGQAIITKIKESNIPINPEDLSELQDAMAALTAKIEALQAIQSGIIAPAYNRDQELKADAAAIQMVMDANFNPHAARRVIRQLGEAQKKIAERTALAIRTASNSAKVIFKIGKKYSDGFGSFLPFDPTDIIFDVATAAAVNFFCEFAKTHPDLQVRLDQVDKLLEEKPQSSFRQISRGKLIDIQLEDPDLIWKKAALDQAGIFNNRLQEILAEADPLRAKVGCGEAAAAETEQALKGVSESVAAAMSGSTATSGSEDSKKPDVNGKLETLGRDILKELREQRRQGHTSVPHLWDVFAQVRRAQADFGEPDKKKKFLSDVTENLQLGLERSNGEAKALMYRNLVLSFARGRDIDSAREAFTQLENKFNDEWLVDLALTKSILVKDIPGILASAGKCALATNFFVQERCLFATVQYRKEIEELKLNPDNLISGGGDKSWWERLKS